MLYSLHASGGTPNWRAWLRRNFGDYNELANAVLKQLDTPMPEIDLGSIGAAPIAPRRTVTTSAATAGTPVTGQDGGRRSWCRPGAGRRRSL